jgi:hypothetical protein
MPNMPRFGGSQPSLPRWVLAVCGTLVLSACASKYAQVPPRLDLRQHRQVALVTFSAAEEHRGMSELATRRFAEALLAGQPGVELLELQASDSVLRSLPRGTDPIVLAQKIGEAKGIPAVFVGELKVSGVKPRAHVAVDHLKLRATVSAELGVRLLSTRAGGTLWRSSSTASGTVGGVALAGGLPSVAVRDTEEAYDEILATLVDQVSADLRPTWVK